VLAAAGFLATTQFFVAIGAIGLLAGAVLANGISTQVAIQTHLPEALRARALSLYTMTFRGGPAAGALLLGTVAELAPLRGVLFGALAVLACGGVVAAILAWRVEPPLE
jgi:Bacterial protein of unknown function (DUF894).